VTILATPTPLAPDDRRTTVPLFTLAECATYLQTPLSTLHAWARPKNGAPLVTMLAAAGRQATVPFIGFAEAFVLGALRKAGVPMQRIRPAVKRLNDEIGLEHALASQRVYTDGAEAHLRLRLHER
jgi:Putative DNA-binding HTH domain